MSDDTSNTVITEPVMIFPNGEVTLGWTRTVRYTANDVPVQAIVEAVRVAAEAEGVEVVQPEGGDDWDLSKPDEYVWQLLDAQVSTVRERVLDVLRGPFMADVDEDDATVESVQEA
jgi:hypothetical protein